MSEYASMLESIRGIAEGLQALNRQAVREYAPIVEGILLSGSRDANHIDRTLDGLLGFCGYEPALVLYKRLCRHYWAIDPVAVAAHINAYRDMWDSEEIGGEGELKNRNCRLKIGVARGDAETRGETETDGEVRNMGVRKMGQDESALADADLRRSEEKGTDGDVRKMKDRKIRDRKMGEG